MNENVLNKSSFIVNESLADQVYHLLEESIINNELAPGSSLSEDEIASQLNVSRSPVREALLRLEHAGLVNKERKSRVVSEITMSAMLENYHLWAMSEAYAASLACHNATPDDIGRARGLLNQLEVSRRDVRLYHELNYQFHAALVAPCPYRRLVELHASAIRNVRWGYNYTLYVMEDTRHSSEEHYSILNAYIQKDTSVLERLIRDHCSGAADRFCIKYSELNPPEIKN